MAAPGNVVQRQFNVSRETMRIQRIYLPKATIGHVPELGIWILERPWLDNKRNISCIPEGTYQIAPDQEGRFTGYQELQDVPGRSEIIIHAANYVHEVQGCLAPNMSIEISGDAQVRGVDPRKALDMVRELAPEQVTIEAFPVVKLD